MGSKTVVQRKLRCSGIVAMFAGSRFSRLDWA
jgi:hypothetical protein